MSDAASNVGSEPKPTTPEDNKSALTAKEEEIFKIAMLKCLKSGAPEIDYQKLMEHGNFNTMKTCQNVWGKIKKKMFTTEGAAKSDDGAASPTKTSKTPKTPKANTTPRKRTKKECDEEGGEEESADTAEKQESESPTKKKKATPKKTPKSKKADTESNNSAEIKREDSAVDVVKAGGEEGDAGVAKVEADAGADE